jgi:hypothetical protein
MTTYTITRELWDEQTTAVMFFFQTTGFDMNVIPLPTDADPVTFTISDGQVSIDCYVLDDNGQPTLDANGQPVMENLSKPQVRDWPFPADGEG